MEILLAGWLAGLATWKILIMFKPDAWWDALVAAAMVMAFCIFALSS